MWWYITATLAIAAVACGSINVRPHGFPAPGALIDTLTVSPDILIQAALSEVTGEGMQVQALSAEEGFLETRWYNPVTRRTVSPAAASVDRAVLLRFRADSVGLGTTQLASEAVIRRTADPSLPSGVAESMAPPDHPGHQLLSRLLASLRGRFGR